MQINNIQGYTFLRKLKITIITVFGHTYQFVEKLMQTFVYLNFKDDRFSAENRDYRDF